MESGQNSFKHFDFLANDHLPQVSRQSRLLADEGDNEMIQGAVWNSSDICLTAVENPGKPQLGDRQMKSVWLANASNGVPYLQIRSVGS